MSSAQTFDFTHPSLGAIVGSQRQDVVYFRGLPYAELPARFRQSSLRSGLLPEQPFDATQPGAICPYDDSVMAPQFWSGPLPPDHPVLKTPVMNEFGCLNLNICAPVEILNASAGKVPVLVFIHGGGFSVGSSTWQIAGREVYDGFDLIRQSRKLQKPVVVVTINYRVGALGFLASKELKDYNTRHGETFGNYGLHDQRTALEWIHRNISAFGGDPSRVTVLGASAGGASAHYQSFFPRRHLQRAVCCSGTTLTLSAMPVSWHQVLFDKFVNQFSKGDDHVVQSLQEVSVDKLVRGPPRPTFYTPVIDDDWIHGQTYSAYSNPEKPVDLLIGSCEFEEDLTLAALTFSPPDTLQAVRADLIDGTGLSTVADTFYTDQVLNAYGISNTPADLIARKDQWAKFCGDIMFRIPPIWIAKQHQAGRIFLYEFTSSNPFPGWPLGHEKAHHAVTDLFLFNSAADLIPDEERRSVWDQACSDWQKTCLEFCYDDLAWQPVVSGEATSQIGPIYKFAHDGITKCDSVKASLADQGDGDRWDALMSAATF